MKQSCVPLTLGSMRYNIPPLEMSVVIASVGGEANICSEIQRENAENARLVTVQNKSMRVQPFPRDLRVH